MPHRFRWALLLAASCIFYMAFIPIYILILIFTIIIDYFAGLAIEKVAQPKKKILLVISIISNVGCLAVFKYFNFINGNVAALATLIHWNYPIDALHIILPIGLSFHTFQAMSYTIEVYRGNQRAERNFGIYALYVMFYPQLVAGPIERPQNLLHQFREQHRFDYQRVTDGLKLMAWGFFKKLVIADRLAVYVNQVYNSPDSYYGATVLLASYFFAFQIFCDFSGYSDIAIGSARVMGFQLMENFNRPYHSQSIAEFWRRWHISLSTWFRDYLFFPLGANKKGKARWYFNIFVVFLLSGLWHGAKWTYVFWGGLNGIYLIFSLITNNLRARLRAGLHLNKFPIALKCLRVAFTFHLIVFGWLFFRANSLSDAFTLINNLTIQDTSQAGLALMPLKEIAIAVIAVLTMETAHIAQYYRSIGDYLKTWPIWLRWSAYYLLIIAILLFGKYTDQQFIYFQF
jgi:D-alanyl-lipoteichoic acid acyltransferase DltB (MBOAT superfamily)